MTQPTPAPTPNKGGGRVARNLLNININININKCEIFFLFFEVKTWGREQEPFVLQEQAQRPGAAALSSQLRSDSDYKYQSASPWSQKIKPFILKICAHGR